MSMFYKTPCVCALCDLILFNIHDLTKNMHLVHFGNIIEEPCEKKCRNLTDIFQILQGICKIPTFFLTGNPYIMMTLIPHYYMNP